MIEKQKSRLPMVINKNMNKMQKERQKAIDVAFSEFKKLLNS